MTYSTDERLKSYLDTNQLARERLALAVLALDKRFSDVRPRHPRGGPDGGRDIEALFCGESLAYGAVGFVNQADDSREKKKSIEKKFSEDLVVALSNDPAPTAFVFFTNVNLTSAEKNKLVDSAKKRGMLDCEIFDRERLRIVLDSADGFAIRFQCLAIPLSEPEQATFFARWGADIQSVIATGFQQVQKTLDHLLFLQEANSALYSLYVVFELDREYSGDEIGHFRAFNLIYLKEAKLDIFSILFGSTDKADRFSQDRSRALDLRSGIKFGVSGGQWEQMLSRRRRASKSSCVDDDVEKYNLSASHSSIGMETVRTLSTRYSKDSLIRFNPVLNLRDLDHAMFLPMMSRKLSRLIKTIHVVGNGYKLLELGAGDFSIDESAFEPGIPVKFTKEELDDPWVRILPSNFSSSFRLSFDENIPERLFVSRRTRNSLPKRE
ncbi:MAG: hypothetical protein ACRCWJ_09265 [Casimicrobium sp.]